MTYLLRFLKCGVGELCLCCCKNGSRVIVRDIERGSGCVQLHVEESEAVSVWPEVAGRKVDNAKDVVDGGSPTDVHNGIGAARSRCRRHLTRGIVLERAAVLRWQCL